MAGSKKGLVERPREGTRLNLSRKDTLLVLCARLELTPGMKQAIKETLTGGLDWDPLMQKAGWHRLSALVAHHLMSSELKTLVPMPVQQRMQNIHYSSLPRNMLLQDELSRLLAIFQKEGIPVIVLKGSVLLDSIYSDISLRPMSDLDILVRPEHLDRVEAIAFEQGYDYPVDRGLQEEARRNCRHLATLWHPQKRIALEIHHHIVSPDEPYRFDLDSFWARAKPVYHIRC